MTSVTYSEIHIQAVVSNFNDNFGECMRVVMQDGEVIKRKEEGKESEMRAEFNNETNKSGVNPLIKCGLVFRWDLIRIMQCVCGVWNVIVIEN